jgi:hypothetical protein
MTYAVARPSVTPSPACGPAVQQLRRPIMTMLTLAVTSAVAVGAAFAVRPLAGLALLAVVAAGLLFSQRPVLAVCVLVGIAPACAGLKRGLVFPGLRISEAAIAGIAILVLLFAARAPRPAWTRVEIMLLVYAVFTVMLGGFDLATRHAPLAGEELGTLIGPFQFVLLVRVIVISMTEERYRVRAAHVMLAAAAVVGLVSLAQYANVGPTRSVLTRLTGSSLFSTSLGERVGRVTGPFNIWHELAGFLMPSILVSLGMLMSTGSRALRVFYGAVFVVTSLALVSTAAAGILLVTTTSALYIAWKRRLLHVALAVALPFALVAAIAFGGTLSGHTEQETVRTTATHQLPFAPQSINYRYALFQEQNEPALAGRWATGFGPDLPPRVALANFPFTETNYVTLLMRGGVPLLVVFVLLMLVVLRSARVALRSAATDFQRCIATVVLATTLGYFPLLLLESYLLDDGPAHAYWAFVGLMLAAADRRVDPLSRTV